MSGRYSAEGKSVTRLAGIGIDDGHHGEGRDRHRDRSAEFNIRDAFPIQVRQIVTWRVRVLFGAPCREPVQGELAGLTSPDFRTSTCSRL